MSDVYLLDGNCFAYRAYHAIKGLSTSKGIPTNAIYGFTRMLLKLIRERNSQYMLIAFDSPSPTRRHMVYKEYKITRPETPRDFPLQLDYIKEIIDALRIRRIEISGYEADDIIATLALSLQSSKCYIVTLDKDMLQLVSDRVKIYDPINDLTIDRDFILRKYGIPPDKLIDFMALVGDSTDNIPGIKGIGEKSASELLKRYGSIEEILRNIHIIRPSRLAKLIKENIDSLRLSKELVTLQTDVPIKFDLDELKINSPDNNRLSEIFRELEFTSLLKEILSAQKTEEEKSSILTADELSYKENIYANHRIAILDNERNLAIVINERLYELSLKDDKLEKILNSDDIKIVFNGRELLKKLIFSGLGLKPPYFDLMIAAYLINPNKGKYDLKDLILEYLGRISDDSMELAQTFKYIFELYKKISSELREKELEEIYFNIEMPLIEVLAHMELAGIKVNINKLEELTDRVTLEVDKIKSKIYFLAGKEFNINSPKQLAEILYDKLHLRSGKRGKKSRSTEMEILEELSFQHELPQEVINYRILNKLLTGYLQPLKDYINYDTKRIHAKWSQTTAGTGRIVSSEPNLQNIPVKGQWAEFLREVFVPEEGYAFLSADYSQIELRILAHLSEDMSLIRAFKDGKDIHRATASEIFSIKDEEVTEEHRRIAKTVNFGISYGISPFGLSESIKIPLEKAQELIELYFLRYPGVKKFIENTIEFAKKNGYVRTIFGRIRPVPDINSPNQFLRQQAERIAVNSVVQGTAADIIKIAMIRIYKRIKSENLNARLILQIHDEIVLEVVEEQIEKLSEVVKEEMTTFNLKTPLELNIYTGKNLNI